MAAGAGGVQARRRRAKLALGRAGGALRQSGGGARKRTDFSPYSAMCRCRSKRRSDRRSIAFMRAMRRASSNRRRATGICPAGSSRNSSPNSELFGPATHRAYPWTRQHDCRRLRRPAAHPLRLPDARGRRARRPDRRGRARRSKRTAARSRRAMRRIFIWRAVYDLTQRAPSRRIAPQESEDRVHFSRNALAI